MRLPRLEFVGARHHVMNRTARRATLFDDPDVRELFFDVLAELPQRFGCRIHAYALMPNHYHLMISSERGELSRGMRHLGSRFTQRVNRANGWDGALFRGRFHNRLVDTDAYWRHLLLYVHANPARAGLDLPTSHEAYAGSQAAPPWLVTDELLEAYGGRAVYVEALHDYTEGRVEPPEDFDPERLWAPRSTNTVDVPDLSRPMVGVGASLREVADVVGLEVDELLARPRGRRGNPPQWMWLWWASRVRGLPHRELGGAIGVGHTGVSQRIARAEAKIEEEPFAGWLRALVRACGTGPAPWIAPFDDAGLSDEGTS